MESTSSLVAVLVQAFVVPIFLFILCKFAFKPGRERIKDSDSEGKIAFHDAANVVSSMTAKQEPNDLEASICATGSSSTEESSEYTVSPSCSPPHDPPAGETKFLDKGDAWKRAEYLFPGLPIRKARGEYDPSRWKAVEDIGLDVLSHKILQLRVQNAEKFRELTKLDNAVDLCIELGANETVVRKRYEAIRNLQREFNIPSKTPTLITIEHLARRISVNDPYGEPKDIHAHDNLTIHNTYKGNKWLSYIGVDARKKNFRNALQSVQSELNRLGNQYAGAYMHGTTATALLYIEEDKGGLVQSTGQVQWGQIGHDFGDGFYCCKEELKQALSFAIDRCWPLFPDTKTLFESHNPAVILFPKPKNISESQFIYKVGEEAPFTDEQLKDIMFEFQYQDFDNSRKMWNGQHRFWKEFVKLARISGTIPEVPYKRVFVGLLHDCESTEQTDQRQEPQFDNDGWVQYCIKQPKRLGEHRLFIELNVDWNEWTDKHEGKEAEKDEKRI